MNIVDEPIPCVEPVEQPRRLLSESQLTNGLYLARFGEAPRGGSNGPDVQRWRAERRAREEKQGSLIMAMRGLPR